MCAFAFAIVILLVVVDECGGLLQLQVIRRKVMVEARSGGVVRNIGACFVAELSSEAGLTFAVGDGTVDSLPVRATKTEYTDRQIDLV